MPLVAEVAKAASAAAAVLALWLAILWLAVHPRALPDECCVGLRCCCGLGFVVAVVSSICHAAALPKLAAVAVLLDRCFVRRGRVRHRLGFQIARNVTS
jgi:hypothetical protein